MQFKHFSAIDIMTISMWISFSALSTWTNDPSHQKLPAPPLLKEDGEAAAAGPTAAVQNIHLGP